MTEKPRLDDTILSSIGITLDTIASEIIGKETMENNKELEQLNLYWKEGKRKVQFIINKNKGKLENCVISILCQDSDVLEARWYISRNKKTIEFKNLINENKNTPKQSGITDAELIGVLLSLVKKPENKESQLNIFVDSIQRGLGTFLDINNSPTIHLFKKIRRKVLGATEEEVRRQIEKKK